eukprot:10897052-Alexandrium_andersonii.AAC.1
MPESLAVSLAAQECRGGHMAQQGIGNLRGLAFECVPRGSSHRSKIAVASNRPDYNAWLWPRIDLTSMPG